MTQLRDLAAPFPDRYIHKNPSGGGTYVEHSTVTQRLLHTVGPFGWELVEVLRGALPALDPDPAGRSKRAQEGAPALTNVVVGGIWRLTTTIDGERIMVEEVGDCEDPRNWPHDGARLKDAASDAIKRCSMRIGLGLHLWCDKEYYLNRQLAKDAGTPIQVEPSLASAKGLKAAQQEATAVRNGDREPPETTEVNNSFTGREARGDLSGRDVLRELSLSANDAREALKSIAAAKADQFGEYDGITISACLSLRGEPLVKARRVWEAYQEAQKQPEAGS